MVMAYYRAPAKRGMKRELRVEDRRAIWHPMNHGERQKPIIREEQDRKFFAETLAGRSLSEDQLEGARARPDAQPF